MRARMRMLLLVLAASVFVTNAQTNNSVNDKQQQQQQQQQPQPQQQQLQQQPQPRSIWDEPIKFNTKTKDTCTMVVSGVGDYTRLRVSCKGPSQTPVRSYYCDFQGKPNMCRAYNLNPRHYFTQMMWELRKLNHACQGAKIYRPQMCKKYSDEVQMTFLASWPKTTTPKPSRLVQETRKPSVPVQKPVPTSKPVKPQPQSNKSQTGKSSQTKKSTPKPGKTTTRPTEHPESRVSRLASEYCWKSFHGICSYFIGWFQN
ncbi:fibroblast growth factor-binding protein 2b [Parambassis ranga]|uniref:Fibroblast growth factor-binding protein 2b n=1 Tax=Parambassis ranga TaxID=210632 RepID=A0A6P7IY34_9TELE|nr:fibroblast growth factor-binding protein 2-like [Parambassis ranga]